MRRTWTLAILTGLLLAPAIPASAEAVPRPAAAPLTPIQHVVVLMQENHSFDNLLGGWCNQKPSRCPAGGIPSSVTLSDGTVVTPSVAPDIVPRAAHEVAAQAAAIDDGKMDGWQNVCAAPVRVHLVLHRGQRAEPDRAGKCLWGGGSRLHPGR